jgi:hypothetical protein
MSFMNYVDDGYVRDDIFERLSQIQPAPVLIPFEGELPSGLPERVIKSVRYYRDWLPQHLADEGLKSDAVRGVTLIVERSLTGPAVFVAATDDRGKSYRVAVAA